MGDSRPTYTQDEVNEIVRRALDEQARNERVLSHEELVEIAGEAGIEREALERATAELAQARTQALTRQVEEREMAAERAVQVRRFGASAVSLSLLSGFLYFIDTQFTGGTWFYWPLLGSGTWLALQLRHVIFPYDKVLKRRRLEEKQRERERRLAEREAWKKKLFEGGSAIAEGAKQFESVVQTGVSALMAIASRKLQEHAEREERRRERDRRRDS